MNDTIARMMQYGMLVIYGYIKVPQVTHEPLAQLSWKQKKIIFLRVDDVTSHEATEIAQRFSQNNEHLGAGMYGSEVMSVWTAHTVRVYSSKYGKNVY